MKWTPLDHAQEEAMPLVEWALTLMGHCNPEEEYANVTASTNHLEILCFVTGSPLARSPKTTKSCSDFLYEAERSMYVLRALAGQSTDSWLPVRGENEERVITWALNRVERTLRYITQPWFQDELGVVRPKFQANRVDGKGLQVSYSLDRCQC